MISSTVLILLLTLLTIIIMRIKSENVKYDFEKAKGNSENTDQQESYETKLETNTIEPPKLWFV